MSLLATTFLLSAILAACGGPAATPPPAPTITPRATPLPTVATEVPVGAAARPIDIVLVPPPDSSATGTSLVNFLKGETKKEYKMNIVTSSADVLAALCSPSPTVAWVDGWTMLAAQAQGCGNVLLKIKRGDSSNIRADLIVSPASTIDSLAALRARAKTRDFCRLNNQDTVSWVLPMIVLRTQGFNPLAAFRDVRDYGSAQDMVQDVSDNKCVAAIPSGTLTNFKLPNISDITRTVKVIATSPELPVGGLMASASVPLDLADQIAQLSRDNLDQLNGLIVADSLQPSSNSEIASARRAFEAVGVSFDALAN